MAFAIISTVTVKGVIFFDMPPCSLAVRNDQHVEGYLRVFGLSK
jgi:hypothetical protein